MLISNINSSTSSTKINLLDVDSNLSSHNADSETMNVGEDNMPSPNSLTEPMECGNSILSMNSPKHLARILNDDVNMSENNSVS